MKSWIKYVVAYLSTTLCIWAIFAILITIVFCILFEMHPSNPEYPVLLEYERIIGVVCVFPSLYLSNKLVK